MKHSDSTEMDRLLRRYARRNGETMRAISDSQSSEAAGAHMDADEMSAYAEGVLPEAALSRYMAHLADCDTCRKIVTNLTLATGVTAKERAQMAVADTSPSKSWREWLAALFSPPVLRYGVPALALLAVIVVAFVATRTQRERQFTAKNDVVVNQTSQPVGAANANMSAPATDTIAENHQNSNVISLGEPQSSASSNSASTATAPVKSLPADQDSPSAPQTSTSQTTDQTPGAASREQGEVLARKDDATTTAVSPPPPEATPATKIEDGKDKQEARKKAGAERDEEKIANQPRPSTAGARPAPNEIAEDGTTASKSEGLSDRTNRARRPVFGAGRATTTTAPSTATQKESVAETRQVSGRQFRRQGSSWVDTAYKSSRSLTHVARGSEQYRALVADEPGLRTVAEQLGGEVIVVWKSRAYRFY